MTRYNAEISAGSLMAAESRRIAVLLLSHPDEIAWQHAVEVENILQKKTPASARRQARLIQRRLTTLDDQAWKMISEREGEVVTQMLLAAAVKHSALLGDFMRHVYADRQRRLEKKLAPSDWQDFLIDCSRQDEAVQQWSDTTKAKLFQVIIRILAEAKYLDNPRSMVLTPRSLHPAVHSFLKNRNETNVLECLERIR